MVGWIELVYIAGAVSTGALAFRDAPQRLLRAYREGRVLDDPVYHVANGVSVLVVAAWIASVLAGWDAPLTGSGGIPWAVKIAGLGLASIGFGIAIAARIALGGAFAPTAAIPGDGRVVEAGPYRYVRHPFYAGLMLALAGGVLALDSRATLAALAALAPLVHAVAVREEAQLVEALGEAYERYLERVPRWVPGTRSRG